MTPRHIAAHTANVEATMTTGIRLREAKALLAANKLAEANNLIETVAYSLLNAENPRQAARVNLIFLGRLAAKRRVPT